LGYDAAGNLTNYTSPGQYVYDQENRLSSTAGMTYTYDGNGERVLKSNTSTGAAVKHYWSMGGNTLAEGDGSGNITAEYIYFGGRRVARIDIPANTLHYYLSDHLGSTSIVVSSSGIREEESDYSPFGTEYVIAGAGVNRYKFTGKERDTESGLDNFGARYNSTSIGRFMTPDPLGGEKIDPQTLNRYSYVRNNPTNLIDPTGLYTCKDQADCKSKQDVAFEKARQQDLKSKDANVMRAANAYGDPTKDGPNGNKVSVGFADLDKKGEGGVTVSTLGADDKGNMFAVSDVTINSKISGSDLDGAVGHEGSHVADAQDVAGSISLTQTAPYFKVGMDISRYTSEQRAYAVSDSILRSENTSQKFACGLSNCVLGRDLTMQSQVPGVVDRILQNSGLYRSNGQPLSPTNQGGSVVNGLTVPH
jgi:RHS repeat-associated protein